MIEINCPLIKEAINKVRLFCWSSLFVYFFTSNIDQFDENSYKGHPKTTLTKGCVNDMQIL